MACSNSLDIQILLFVRRCLLAARPGIFLMRWHLSLTSYSVLLLEPLLNNLLIDICCADPNFLAWAGTFDHQRGLLGCFAFQSSSNQWYRIFPFFIFQKNFLVIRAPPLLSFKKIWIRCSAQNALKNCLGSGRIGTVCSCTDLCRSPLLVGPPALLLGRRCIHQARSYLNY